MRKWFPLQIILLAYLIMGALFAIFTPDWQAPDEPAHYNYVRQLAAGNLPVIEPEDYDQDYLFEVVFESHFAPGYSLETLEYEDWQPPLYYLLLTPVFWLSGGSLLALRLFSVALGAGVVALAYLIAHRLFPESAWVAMSAAVFIAFLPQHLSILASVNNDSLAELLIAAILLTLVRWLQKEREQPLRDGRRLQLTLSLLLGLGFLTKGTVYSLTLVVGLLLIWRFWGDWQRLLYAGLTVFGPAIILGSLWWGRNLVVYGGLDVLGKVTHDAIVVGQPRTADLIAQVGLAETTRRFVQTTFNSFWGQFGWMTLPLQGWIYRPLWWFSGVVILGLLVQLGNQRRRSAAEATRSRLKSPAPFVTLILVFLLTTGVHIGYNLTFEQHQGRYLFPALVPIGIGVALGLEGWLRPFSKQHRFVYYLIPFGLAATLISLDLWVLFRVIVPAFS